ncbi:transposase [Bifidobacterium longum]|uniref:transposase n=1 Tax=Bifidobacterium longum TaxID=216816 RepID=UPI00374F0E19
MWRESPGVRCRGFFVCGYGRGVLLLGLFPSGTQAENRGNAFARHIGRRVQAYAQSARERRDRRAARREGPAWRGRRHRAPMLRQWAADASLSGIAEFARLGEKIDRRHFDILRTTRAGLSNARLEAVNNKIKTTIKIGYGYRNLGNLIALIMLKCGGLNLRLPGRQ